MGFIYMIQNKINNKIYIGKTIRSISERWREHQYRAENNYNGYLYNAIRKYGIENFTVLEIEKCEDEIIDERERFYISFYDSLNNQKGYNLTNGGDGNNLYNYDLIREYWDQGKSCGQIIDILKCDKSVILSALKNYETYSIHESLSRRNRKGVNQYDLQGNLICHYDSIISAAKGNTSLASGIGNCCNKKQTQCNNYLWSFEGEKPIIPTTPIKRGKRKILQYDLNNNYIKEFESAAAAAREVSPEQNSNVVGNQILQVCKGNRKTAKGFVWRYGETK